MAITIDWQNRVINVPKADMALVQLIPVEVRELDLNAFRLELKALESSEVGMQFPITHNHNPTVTISGLQYARVVEIINDYTVTFEDGQYAVNLVGANSNVGDRVNVNQVSVRSANSAGLIQTRELEYSSFQGGVWLDVVNGTDSTTYPSGTSQKPCKTLANALFIANLRGFARIYLVAEDNHFMTGDTVTAFEFVGALGETHIHTDVGSTFTDCQFDGVHIHGQLFGTSHFDNCNLGAITGLNGEAHNCVLELGTSQLAPLANLNLIDCRSGIVGAGKSEFDCNGSGDLQVRGYIGGLRISNKTSGDISVDMISGSIEFTNTCTGGSAHVRGTAVLTNDSAGMTLDTQGLVNFSLEAASFNGRVAIDTLNGVAGTAYPIGTLGKPSNNLADAKAIALARGFDSLYVIGSLTIASGESVNDMNIYGKGATFNVKKTTITFDSGCTTSGAHFYDCYVLGTQGGESNYHDCLIGELFNTHCWYERCKMVGPIQVAQLGSTTHQTAYFDCYSGVDACVFDRNGSRVKQVFNNWNGKVKFINATHASYVVEMNIVAGEVEIDSSCTAGTFILRGNGRLINNSSGATVDASALTNEGFDAIKYTIESQRPTHQAFGERFYVDPINGNDANAGTSDDTPLATVAAALAKAVSGRGDLIILLAPGAGAATITERVVIDKEDIHIRGPGRGVQFQPTTPSVVSEPVIDIRANNCSLSGFIIRTPVGGLLDDAIWVSGKFSRIEKLYLVGPGQGVGTGRGLVYQAGDYHECYDIESEKFGDSGIEMDDINHPTNGSPREITISGGNVYLNGEHGICLHGRVGAALGTTTRIIRLIGGLNVHDNTSYGIHSDPNCDKLMVDSSVAVHGNNGGGDQTNYEGPAFDMDIQHQADTAVAVWDVPTANVVKPNSVGEAILNSAANVLTVLKIEQGNWEIVGTQMIFKDAQDVEIMRFNLFNELGGASATNVYKRERV